MKRLLLPLCVLALNLQLVMAETVQVDIVKFKFSPQQLTINAGDTVVWTNREKRQYHNVWFQDLVSEEPDIFFLMKPTNVPFLMQVPSIISAGRTLR
nr:plastocyanin/azurin family copper-binding protein [Aliamphritea spongicola]